MPSGLQLSLLGAIKARRSDGEAVAFPTRKCQALLALLAVAGGLSRERCASMLWSRSAETQARASLRQCVLATHRALGPDAGALLSQRDSLALAPGFCETDLAVLDSLECADAPPPSTSALLALRGELFGDFSLNESPFEDWQRQERSRHAHRLNRALAQACHRWRECGDLSPALDAALIAAEADPLSEASLRELMRCHLALGSVGQALAAFNEHRRRLQTEVGSEPSAETMSLAQDIRRRGETLEHGDDSHPGASHVPILRIEPIEAGGGSSPAGELARDLHDALVFRAARRRGIRLVHESTAASPPVDYALRGRVSVRGTSARVTLRLNRAATGEDVWVEQIDGDMGSQFELVDRICARVDAAVRLWTNAFDAQRIADVADADLAPAQILTRAAGHLYEASIADHEKALLLINSVLAVEPRNAMAKAMRVEVEAMLTACGAPRATRALSLRDCLLLADEAVSLDSRSDYGFAIRALLKIVAIGDPQGGLADAERSLALVPGFVWGLLTQAYAHLALGSAQRALDPLETVLSVSGEDPYLPLYAHALCRAALLTGDPGRAEEAARLCVARLPGVASFQLLHATSIAALGGPAAATPALQRAAACDTPLHLLAIRAPIAARYAGQRTRLLDMVSLDANDERSRFVL